MSSYLIRKAVDIIKEDVYMQYKDKISFPIFSMIFDTNLREFFDSLQVDVSAEITNIEDYKNAAEDER